ncbi:hypothetical protein [Tateyamaria sp. syn59]|uniref:hypothetical protein n=1 Tax=Tateyamaria sp. syn59 TaxID=2576942 RepID=UPI0011BF80F2|nr:hypothetical protein [Tateyamaria sp. syn59]
MLIRNILSVLSLTTATACTTDRVRTDFDSLSDVATRTREALAPRIAPALEAERQAEITAAAQNGDTWLLSEGCAAVLNADASVATSACRIEKIPTGNRTPTLGPASALDRRMKILEAYIASLDLLTDPSLEGELVTAIDSFIDGLDNLGTATESDALLAFAEQRREKRKDTETVVTAAISGLRYTKMRGAVLQNEDTVADLVRTIQLSLIELGLEPGFVSRRQRLRAAEERSELTEVSDVADYRDALATLETEHTAFMEYYKETLLYRVGLIEEAHSALARQFRDGASAKEVSEYLKVLVAVSDSI